MRKPGSPVSQCSSSQTQPAGPVSVTQKCAHMQHIPELSPGRKECSPYLPPTALHTTVSVTTKIPEWAASCGERLSSISLVMFLLAITPYLGKWAAHYRGRRFESLLLPPPAPRTKHLRHPLLFLSPLLGGWIHDGQSHYTSSTLKSLYRKANVFKHSASI